MATDAFFLANFGSSSVQQAYGLALFFSMISLHVFILRFFFDKSLYFEIE